MLHLLAEVGAAIVLGSFIEPELWLDRKEFRSTSKFIQHPMVTTRKIQRS